MCRCKDKEKTLLLRPKLQFSRVRLRRMSRELKRSDLPSLYWLPRLKRISLRSEVTVKVSPRRFWLMPLPKPLKWLSMLLPRPTRL
jgi:hypothetical protein